MITASRAMTCAGGREPRSCGAKLALCGCETGAPRVTGAVASVRLGTLIVACCTGFARTKLSRDTTVTAPGAVRLTYRMLVVLMFVTLVTCAMFTFCTYVRLALYQGMYASR